MPPLVCRLHIRERTWTPMNLIHTAIGLAVPLAIVYVVTTYQQRDPERFNSAHRAGLTIALLFALWMLIPHVRAYAHLVMQTTRDSHKITAQLHKLKAADLQTAYLQARVVSPKAGLRCTQAERDWDYVCSYMPTPLRSKTRLSFGVIVDETRVLQTSRPVPEGTSLPPPMPQ
jgi:type VI protein secretion system component VasK